MEALIIIGVVIVWVSIFWFINEAIEDEPRHTWVPFTLLLIGSICFCIGLARFCTHDEYKQGQIDYHNGIIKYELKSQPDSTVTWEEIKTK